jgi:hypothetical protein
MSNPNTLSRENYAKRNLILADATPWQVAELINFLAQNLEPFYKPDPSDKTERLSQNPLFADMAKEPVTIKLYAIRTLSNTLDRIYEPE